jgi:VanZ family protein
MRKLIEFMRKYWVMISVLILTFITALSLLPLAKLSPVSGSDKIHHFIAYAMLMFPVSLRKPKCWPVYGLFFILWSGSIELLQPFVNRYGEWMDLAANSIGLVFGMLTARLANLLLHANSGKK